MLSRDFNSLYKEVHSLPECLRKALRAALWCECGQMFAHTPTEEQLEKCLDRVKRNYSESFAS